MVFRIGVNIHSSLHLDQLWVFMNYSPLQKEASLVKSVSIKKKINEYKYKYLEDNLTA